MKKQVIYILFTLFSFQGFSQTLTPEFEFQLYFEDAAGNKDTVTLGYDALATGGIDADFGEVNILNEPWGNSLDVRIGDKNYITIPQAGGPADKYWPINWINQNNAFLTKKQIVGYTCNNRSDTISIQFLIENLPITLTWNGDLFHGQCLGSSSIYGGQLWSSSDMNNGIGLLTVGYNTVEISKKQFTDSLFLYNPNTSIPHFPIATYIEGSDSIGVVQLVFENSIDLSIANDEKDNLIYFPNPFKNEIVLEGFDNIKGSGHFIEIFSSDGKLVLHEKTTKNAVKINTIELKKGFYFLKISTINGETFKTIKLTKY